jgi:hypothetical protein
MANSLHILIDFMFNAKLLDHNAHMQKELEEANLQPTNLDNSTCTIDVKASQPKTKYSFHSMCKVLDDILAGKLTSKSNL